MFQIPVEGFNVLKIMADLPVTIQEKYIPVSQYFVSPTGAQGLFIKNYDVYNIRIRGNELSIIYVDDVPHKYQCILTDLQLYQAISRLHKVYPAKLYPAGYEAWHEANMEKCIECACKKIFVRTMRGDKMISLCHQCHWDSPENKEFREKHELLINF